MNGDVSIGYVIAIIIAIIAMAIIIYIVYDVLRGGSWDCAKCRTQFTTWCLDCYRSNVTTPWSGGPNLGDSLYECVKKCNYWPSASGSNQDCQNAEVPCKNFLLYIND